jgi:hypothetical protein
VPVVFLTRDTDPFASSDIIVMQIHYYFGCRINEEEV